MNKSTGFVYLAAPYTDKDPKVQRKRFTAVCAATAQLMSKGIAAFSPLTHTVPLEDLIEDAGHDFWMFQDLAILDKADKLFVLMLPGWLGSRGVTEEIDFAHKHKIPITYLTMTELAEIK